MSMLKEHSHSLIVIPGLGDNRPLQNRFQEAVLERWRKYGFSPQLHILGWHDGEVEFAPKLKKLVALVDDLAEKSDKVSLIGTSAGGSVVLNAFIERSNVIHKVVNVCGRLRSGDVTGFRTLEAKSASSPGFRQSVLLFESKEETLTEAERQRVMTVRAMFGDELVPANTTILRGAYNTRVPTPEHMLSIATSLTVFSKPIVAFLTRDDGAPITK